jgi:ribulose bisphosphate carboxylase small subunit
MTIHYQAGTERKKLVAAAATHLGVSSSYQGMPSAAYIVGAEYTITRESALIGPDDHGLVEALRQQGFAPQEEHYDDRPEQPDRLTIEVPIGEDWTPDKLVNLEKLVASRAALLMKVLGVDSLPIEQTGSVLRFDWFPVDNNAMVYSQLVCALVRTAQEATRITAKERSCESERFHMRTYLLKIGFIGDEFKEARKVLTRGLSGSGSYARAEPPQTDTQTSHIKALCNHSIITPREMNAQPVTPQEILDCMLLTAALDRENAPQIKKAMEAFASCRCDTADICKRNLGELRRLPKLLREAPVLLTDTLDLEDRLAEMTAAAQAMRVMAAENPNQAEYLNPAADAMETWWQPLTLEEIGRAHV